MRILPILTAIAVSVVLYYVVLERDVIVALASGAQEETQNQEVTPATLDPVEKQPAVSILALKSTSQSVDAGIVLRGRTEAARNINVRAEISGLVISQPIRKGTFVDNNQLLCKLESGTRQAALAEANARLAEAQINENAASKLAQKGFGSETAVTARRASLEAAQAAVERAQKDIERLEIRAPFAGLLESDTAELGSLLQPGSLCANIIQLDPIKLVGFVPEQDVSKVKEGALAGARLIGGEEVLGQLSFLSRSADKTTRTFRVEVEVPNPDLAIRDGSTAEIFIAFDGQKAHLLPQSALTLDDAGQLGVRTVVDSTAKFVAVEILRDSTKGVWLTGLPETADVIVVGQEYVSDGRAVKVTYRETAQ